jgi:serine/threonine protein kinase
LYQFTELNDLQASWDPKQPLDKLSEADRKAAIQKICLELVQDFGSTPSKVSQSRGESLRAAVQERLGNRYTITDEIASGKFSVVYQARREHPKRTVAVKAFVASELDEWARRAFIDGVERAFELASPAFIKILEHYLDESPEFLVSEFVPGEPLNRVLQAHPNGLPLARVKSILLDLSKAIEEANLRGWQRGELCPSDVLIEESGLARISPLDFSNLLRDEAQLRGEYLVDRESLAYMTPERYFGREPTLLTDQYSLGLIAAELLGGPRIPRVVRPCDLEAKRPLFADLESGESDWAKRSFEFAGVVRRMLRVDPEDRWPSMRKVRDLLRGIEVPETPAERDRKIATSSYVCFQASGIEGQRQFYGRFYGNLFAAAPEVKRYFASIDMERQYTMLNRAVNALLEFDPQSPESQERLAQIAARHARFELTRYHYEVFLGTLLKTIEECGESDPGRLTAWRNALTPGIDFLWQCEEKQRPTAPPPAQSEAPAGDQPKEQDARSGAKRTAAPASAA